MINTSYIHHFDLLDQIEINYRNSMNAIQEASAPLLLLEQEIEDKLFFNESIDDSINAMEGVEDAFFEKIGKAVLEIIERCRKTIIDIVTKFREKMWSNKSTLAKKEMILKKCPNLSERVKTSLDKNMIDLSELKSFEDFNKNYEKLLDELEKAEDESKVKSKWEKLKLTMDKNSDRIIKASKVAVAVVTIAGLIGIGRSITQDAEKIDPTAMEKVVEHNLEKTNSKCSSLIRARNNKDVKTKMSLYATMAADYERITTGKINRFTAIKLNALSAVDKAYSKVIPNAQKKSQENISKMYDKYVNTSSNLEDRLYTLKNVSTANKNYGNTMDDVLKDRRREQREINREQREIRKEQRDIIKAQRDRNEYEDRLRQQDKEQQRKNEQDRRARAAESRQQASERRAQEKHPVDMELQRLRLENERNRRNRNNRNNTN